MKIFLEMSCFLDLVGICPSLSHKILIQTPLQYSALLPAELMPLQWQSVHWNLCEHNSFLLRYEYFGDTLLLMTWNCEQREKQI